MKRVFVIVAYGLGLVLGILSAPHQVLAQAGKAYFKGKTITYIVATAAGGGHDFYARLMAHHMKRFLPGCDIIVVNKPGAGHMIGTNLIYAARPNGLTIGTFSTGMINTQIIGVRKGIRFDLTKMSWIGKQATDTPVLIVSDKSGYTSWDDVVKAKKPILIGVAGVGSNGWNQTLMLAHAFNLNVKPLPGYSGSENVMGMLRGDIQANMSGLSSGLEVFNKVPGKIVLQFGDDPGVPASAAKAQDIAKTPMQKAIAQLMAAQGALNRLLAGPPKIPQDRLDALRAAFRQAHLSKEYRAQADKAHRPYDKTPWSGDKLAQVITDTITKMPPEIVAFLRKISKVKAPMVKHTGPVTRVKRGGRRVWIKYKGKEVKTKISGSRTTVTINGKKTKRKNIKVGMTCTFTYPRPGAESKRVDCK